MTALEKTTANLTLATFDQEAVMKHLGLNPRDPATQALLLVCQKYDLDPILKHALLIKGRLYVTRDGLLHVAHRSGVFDGMEVLEQGNDQTHFTAKVSVYRKDMGRPFTYIGRYPKSGQIAKDYGPEMAVKVAEVMAMRRAFDVAICAAEERWDDEAQKEMAQADNGQPDRTPTQAERRAVDVTREVQAAAGLSGALGQPSNEEALQAWAKRISEIADRVRQIAPPQSVQDVQAVLDLYNWREDVAAAKGCYEDLVALGTHLKAEADAQKAKAAGEPMPAETMATKEQIGQLQAAAKGLGADTSEKRAALWGYWLEHDQPCGTTTLNEEEAAWLLGTKLASLNPEQRAEELTKALAKFGGAA